MKFQIKQPDLAKALSIVAKIVAGKNTLPVLDNVLIEAKEQTLEFTTTSLEVSISQKMQATVSTEGKTTIPVKLLQSYISLINSDEEIEIEVDTNQTAHLRAKNSKTEIKTIAAEEFPAMPTVKKEKVLNIEAKALASAISDVAFACSTDQIRPVLTGVLFKSDEKELTLAGTDSYRLAERKVPLADKSDEMTVIIPARFATEAARIFGDTKEEIQIILSRHQLVFKSTDSIFITRNIEGRFPPYAQIIPTDAKSSIEMNVEQATRDIRRTSLFTAGGNITIEFTNAGVTISSVSQEGSDSSQLVGDAKGDVDTKITFKATYMLDMLSHIKTENCSLVVNSEKMPALIRPQGDEKYSYVIMPVNP